MIHNTKSFKNLKNIISEKSIKTGDLVPEEDRFLSGVEPEPYIFGNIHFWKLKNLEFNFPYTLVFDNQIMNDIEIQVVAGWGNYEIVRLHPKDSKKSKKINQKIRKIYQFIKNPTRIPKRLLNSPSYMQHELRFIPPKKHIEIKKCVRYILVNTSDKERKQIISYLKKHKLSNIQVMSGEEFVKMF